MVKCDFSGWATRANLLCGDGRTIRKDAFKDNDGCTVPLIWNHEHNDPEAVLGHALLENREEGVYAYCTFNESKAGQAAKEAVEHGDVRSLSIWANKLKQVGKDVVHGCIRELSLVLAGANPGATIDFVMAHGADSSEEEDEAIINYDESALVIYHSDEAKEEPKKEDGEADEKSEKKKTRQEILDSMNEDQKNLMYEMVGEALKHNDEDETEVEETETENEGEVDETKADAEPEKSENEIIEHSEGGNETMKSNVFDKDTQQDNVLAHSEILSNAIADGKRFGSLKESILQHAAANNITDIGELFPKEKDLNVPPQWIKEDDSWVSKVMGGVHHTPFSRVRALFAKMDEAEARARGYIKKGEKKLDLKLAVLKRTTAPTTVYIKMTMDRDDMIDMDFDGVTWIRSEARNQLNRELARAYLLGDNRDKSSDDKIDELCIRPIISDDDMYTIKYTVTDGKDFHNDFNSASENDSEAKGVVRAAVKSRKTYKGSGNPTFFTTEDLLTELLLTEDQNGHRLYKSTGELATAMRVKEIVTVPEMEEYTDIYGIIVNMADYNVGADKGGAVTMFDDFDIDYNQQKYLMETRCSGALVKPYSAIVLKKASPATGE